MWLERYMKNRGELMPWEQMMTQECSVGKRGWLPGCAYIFSFHLKIIRALYIYLLLPPLSSL